MRPTPPDEDFNWIFIVIAVCLIIGLISKYH